MSESQKRYGKWERGKKEAWPTQKKSMLQWDSCHMTEDGIQLNINCGGYERPG